MFVREISFDPPVNQRLAGYSSKALMSYSYSEGWRTNVRSNISEELPQQAVDPYGWFLSEDVRRKMDANGAQYVPDRGHPWYNERHTVTGSGDMSFTTNPYSTTYLPYTGLYLCNKKLATGPFRAGTYAVESPNWTDDLAAFGQQAISKVKPKAHVFDAAAFLGELREGLPKLVGLGLLKTRAKKALGAAGGEYLNVQFGWKPLLNDLTEMLTALVQVDETLRKLSRQVGKPKHRRYALPTQRFQDEKSSIGKIYLYAGFRGFSSRVPVWAQNRLNDAGLGGGMLGEVTIEDPHSYFLRTCETTRWFEGSFTSFFDYPVDSDDYVRKALSLMNFKLTPEVLWELAPWSWMIDWFAKIQNTLGAAALASDQKVVMNYGYVMERARYRSVLTFSPYSSYGNFFPSANTKKRYTVVTESQYNRRIRANPFGFEVSSFGGFSLDQLAILAALGISKR